jgi:hypothetical protein
MNKIANTFDRIYEYMDRNPDKVSAAWSQASQLPLSGPTASELLCDEMGPYGFPRLNTSFFDLVVLDEPSEPLFDNAWFDKVMEGFNLQDIHDPDIGFITTSASVAGIKPATLIFIATIAQ